MKKAAIIVAAGKGTRMGANTNKVFLTLENKPVIVWTVEAFAKSGLEFDKIVVTAGKSELSEMRRILREYSLSARVIEGGWDRQESVRRGVEACGDVAWIAVHDGARPLVTRQVIEESLYSAMHFGSGVAAVPVKDTIKRADGDVVVDTLDRSALRAIQTPQTFRSDWLRKAHNCYAGDPDRATDDAMLLERLGREVHLSPGDPANIKLTTPEDLVTAASILRSRTGKERRGSMRIGHGYDVHRLVEERKLILCGVEVPYEKGLLGHSDADVALHALMDALLGAAALGDIGRHFPDSDEQYRGADSTVLLDTVMQMLEAKGYSVVNADITIICQRPKLAPYIEQMKNCVAQHLRTAPDQVNVKATTTEHLGFEGEGLGISCHAVACIQEN